MDANETSLNILKQFKTRILIYDSSDDENYLNINVPLALKKRYLGRINFFKTLKRKYNLNFNTQADELFFQLIDFLYYKKNINYTFFLRKICEHFKISHNLKFKKTEKNEEIWKNFILKTL